MAPRKAVTLAILCSLLALGAVAWVRRDFLFRRIGEVREAVLYRSATLSEERLEELVREHGIKTILNVRSTDLEADRRVAARRGARYAQMPSRQVPSAENVARFLEIMDDPTNHPVLVHCMHGMGRTGVYCAIYRMEYEGWSVEEALEEAHEWALGGSFYPGQDKTEFLRSYVPRRDREESPPPAR